jgi:hypothetical protein
MDGETTPTSTSGRVKLAVAVLLAIAGQAVQNISLPLALYGNEDMGVFLVYTAFVFFVFFSILDVILDVLTEKDDHISLHMSHRHMAVVGLENALNGVGAIFGGSSSRTPLTLQMSFVLFVMQMGPWYKLVRTFGGRAFGGWVKFRDGISRQGLLYYGIACSAYVASVALVVQDKVANQGSGSLNAFFLFFLFGAFMGMAYNVEQDIVMGRTQTLELHTGVPIGHTLSFLQYMKRDVCVLRRQLTWVFIFSWIGVLLSFAGASQGGALTHDRFIESWSAFIGFGDMYMNLFNLGFIITFFTNIYVNRYDSAFTVIISNVAAVSSMWTGWIPSISAQTVGFSPSIWKTVTAMVLSGAAIYPSYKFSEHFKKYCATLRGENSEEYLKLNNPVVA